MKNILKVILAVGMVFLMAAFLKFSADSGVSGTETVQTAEEAPHEAAEENQQKEKLSLEDTAINYQIVYNLKITSPEMALDAIREEGQRQRENYENPPVEAIELKMEEEFGISAVNLGEMSEKTALAVYDAFAYMYEKYPRLYGSLTNLTLGNMGNRTGGTLAKTDRMAFIVNGSYGEYPFVEKYLIILNARAFLDDEALEETCTRQMEYGYWPKGSNVSSLLVHELGHQLQNVIVQKQFGLTCPYYITEENGESFALYHTDRMSRSDNITEEILEKAYEKWQEDYEHPGEYEEFVESISRYAMGDEKENRYSPSETFAEAFADIYLNGTDASDAAKAIEAIAEEYLK